MIDYTKNLSWQKSHPDMKLSYNLDYDAESIWQIPALSSELKELPFYVQEVGLTVVHQNYYVYRENLESVLFIYTLSGDCTLEYNGHTCALGPGDAAWIDCVKPHSYQIAKGCDKLSVYFVHTYGSGIKEYTNYFKNINITGSFNCGQSDLIPFYFKQILGLYHHADRTTLTDFKASTYVSMLALALLEQAEAESSTGEPDYIKSIKEYFKANYSEKITMKALSDKYFLSEAHLQKQFKKHAGTSPANYLKQLRIEKAKQLLRTTPDSIAEIAEKSGFGDTSYFILVFKASESVTPLEYRKMWAYIARK